MPVSIPVGYVDAYYQFLDRPALVEACDVVLANCYPFWEGADNQYAISYLDEMIQLTQRVANGKKVIITETGWPSTGEPVEAAKPFGIPVTVKMRIGIDSDHETYLEAAQSAADLGVAWVALHARTAAQMYEGKADWSAIARLVEHLKPTGVPVLGNGDIWSGSDAVSMVEQSGCAGVVVGRGCLGRPWLFTDLVSALKGEGKQITPTLHEVREVMFRHANLIVEYLESEDRGMRDMRKHMAWYLKGFRVPREIRHDLGMVSSLQEMRNLLDQLEDQPYPTEVGEKPRGRTSHGRPPTLPDGWLNDPDELVHVELEDAFSGG